MVADNARVLPDVRCPPRVHPSQAVRFGAVSVRGFILSPCNEHLSTSQMSSTTPVDPRALRVVKYTARWCAPCRRIEPQVAALTTAMGVQYDHVDVDECDAALVEHVTVVPTLRSTRIHG